MRTFYVVSTCVEVGTFCSSVVLITFSTFWVIKKALRYTKPNGHYSRLDSRKQQHKRKEHDYDNCWQYAQFCTRYPTAVPRERQRVNGFCLRPLGLQRRPHSC